MNLNRVVESSQKGEGRACDFNNERRGGFRGRGRGNFRGRGRSNNFNQGRGNNFRSHSQGRGENNFGPTNRGRGRGNNYQGRFNCFHCERLGHKAVDCRFIFQNNYNTQANVAENQYQNIGENTNASKSLFLASNNVA